MKLYTLQEVADILRVSVGTVRNWRVSGKINAKKINGAVRVTQEELEKMLGDD